MTPSLQVIPVQVRLLHEAEQPTLSDSNLSPLEGSPQGRPTSPILDTDNSDPAIWGIEDF